MGSATYLANKYLFDPNTEMAIEYAPSEEAPLVLALRLRHDIEAGDVFKKKMLEWRLAPIGPQSVPLFTKTTFDFEEWEGAVATRRLSKNTFLDETLLIRPSEAGYLKALLGEGMRATAVTVENLSEFDGLHTGDYVDLILTYDTPSNGVYAGEPIVKTILEGAPIIVPKAEQGNKASGKGKLDRSLLLALSANDVELVTLAETVGELRISLNTSDVVEDLPGSTESTSFSVSDLFPGLKPGPAAFVQDGDRKIRIMRGGDISVLTLSEEGNKLLSQREK